LFVNNARGQTVSAAGDGARFVQQALAGAGVEHGASQVGEASGEGGFIQIVAERPRLRISRERLREARAGRFSPLCDAGGDMGFVGGNSGEAGFEPDRVHHRYGEWTKAADGAAGVASQVRTGSLRGGFEGGVDNLQELAIGGDTASVIGLV
jgi:hypothetical protein